MLSIDVNSDSPRWVQNYYKVNKAEGNFKRLLTPSTYETGDFLSFFLVLILEIISSLISYIFIVIQEKSPKKLSVLKEMISKDPFSFTSVFIKP